MERFGNTFTLWTPVETFEKATDPTDYDNMRLKGIASTEDEDLDREVLESGGFAVDYLLDRGFINWHHQAKQMPAAIIGEPEHAEITEKGLYVEGKLYDTPIARQAYDMAKTLKTQSKRRRLGWSIEGIPLERSGKRIKKAMCTGLALTHSPKNASTWADLAKAFTDGSTTEKLLKSSEFTTTFEGEDYDFVFETNSGTYLVKGNKIRYKALNIGSPSGEPGSGRALARESLEGGRRAQKKNDELLKRVKMKYPKISDKMAKAIVERVIAGN